jgi:hypothetical protein
MTERGSADHRLPRLDQAVAVPVGRSPRSLRVGTTRRSKAARLQPEVLTERRRTSLALQNLRGVSIVFVLTMHASLAYLVSAPERPAPFGQSPYLWVAFPVVDARRWLGLDIFCAWLDVYLMCLLFFVAGLFVVGGVERYGAARFLGRRLLRLGVPLCFGVAVLMPVALYPVYRMTAREPNIADYFHAYTELPFVPCGPLWFLGQLLALTILGMVLCRYARPAIDFVERLTLTLEARPARAFSAWALISIGAYAPLALIFTPWRWENWGPFAVQLCRPAL